MRTIDVKLVTDAFSKLCKYSCYYLPEKMMAVLEDSVATEESPLGKEILENP